MQATASRSFESIEWHNGRVMAQPVKITRANLLISGAPGEIRTPDLLVRSQALYPTELRAHLQTKHRQS